MKWKTLAGLACLGLIVNLCSKDDEPKTQASINVASAETPKPKSKPPKKDPSAAPKFETPIIKLWQPNFATNKVCNPPTGECKAIPRDDFFCVHETDFDSNLKAERTIIDAGKACKKWGESWLTRQTKGNGKKPPNKNASMDDWNAYLAESKAYSEKVQAEIPKRPEMLDNAVASVVDFYMKKQIHISWLNGSSPSMSVPQSPDLICYSKKDQDKKFEFISDIYQRCYEWGDSTL